MDMARLVATEGEGLGKVAITYQPSDSGLEGVEKDGS